MTGETTAPSCAQCGAGCADSRYQVFHGEARVVLCARCAWLFRPFVKRAAFVAVLVGSCLTIINQADPLLTGHVSASLLGKVSFTYLVPFVVSLYSSVTAARARS